MDNPQHHTIRKATAEELATAKSAYLLAKSELLERLKEIELLLATDEPIQGGARTRLVSALTNLQGEFFNKLDARSYEYFEKLSVGVIEINN